MIAAIRPRQFRWYDYSRYTFSLGIDLGEDAFISGHTASEYEPAERRMVVKGDITRQTVTAYAKIEAILAAAGYDLDDISSLVEYITPDAIDSYAAVEAARRELLSERPIVRTVCVNALLRPEALIEIEVTARKNGQASDPTRNGLLYLPSCLASDDAGELRGVSLFHQMEAVYERAGALLKVFGLSWNHLVKTISYITPAAVSDYSHADVIRKERVGVGPPAETTIVMKRLRHPDALIQIDLTASRVQPVSLARKGLSRDDHDGSPAVRVGNLLFLSGLTAFDPERDAVVGVNDVTHQAECVYAKLERLLDAVGSGRARTVRTTEYVTMAGLGSYRETASVRSRFLCDPYPASTGIVCERLLRPDLLFEVDPTAVILEDDDQPSH